MDFFSNLWVLLKYWIIWTFIEMKPCEKFRGKNHFLVELFTIHRHLKCDPDYTLLFVRRQKTKRLETTGFIFNNVLNFKSVILLLLYIIRTIHTWTNRLRYSFSPELWTSCWTHNPPSPKEISCPQVQYNCLLPIHVQ